MDEFTNLSNDANVIVVVSDCYLSIFIFLITVLDVFSIRGASSLKYGSCCCFVILSCSWCYFAIVSSIFYLLLYLLLYWLLIYCCWGCIFHYYLVFLSARILLFVLLLLFYMFVFRLLSFLVVLEPKENHLHHLCPFHLRHSESWKSAYYICIVFIVIAVVISVANVVVIVIANIIIIIIAIISIN